MINIPKTITDPFYRYQRQKVKIESLKMGNRITNLSLLSNSIYLKPNTIMKYFQKKIGCLSKEDILYNKNITATDLDNLLEELILLLLCNKCNNPEIAISKEKKLFFIKCNACGNIKEFKHDLKNLLSGEC